ncbi:MAG: hypothetical protein NTY88_04320 [Bacteroidetes bacterium]|nr:hypothetical protein [Bacteroidota bacterium]
MKLLNETTCELINTEDVFEDERISGEPDFTKEGTDTGFSEGADELCNDCKEVGFCRIMQPEKFAQELQRVIAEKLQTAPTERD